MSCLFQSLGALAHFDPTVLRQSICDYLAANPDLMGDGTKAAEIVQWEQDGQRLQTYVQKMRQSSEWGGGIEICAFVNMTAHKVIVHDLRHNGRKIKFRPCHRYRTRKILHISWNGSHYEPMGTQIQAPKKETEEG